MTNFKTIPSIEALYTQYYPMVLQMSLGFVKGDRPVAKDLAQQVFINVWSALDQFKETASYKTWIYRITVNTCLQYLRKQKTKPTARFDEVAYKLQQVEQPQENQDHSELYTAIGQLNEVDRLLIMMVLEEQEYEDIAEVMGISAVNVRVKIHRIKKRLKKILQDG
ncbi:RNA polymerase sigma factor [Aquimarina brevivitae]|uniref:RNA polymerase sigma-70 factor (ECF subfamily) n=1 Tax=Aquimarina brevivitae TaxID=323412 RepID=A0A4Q7P081_9FLAO|nr:sigma-70 family RNA polymerase sigma factor [Aquimarina brevivitae]RZS93183.1 RNA polymerase sigma-70 factor (ECF subfamily) [Aquimarina brevivitae]